MSTHDTEALLRGAMEQELEDVMTTLDVERELAAFQDRQRRRDGRRRTALAVAASVAVVAAGTGGYALLADGRQAQPADVLAPRALEDGELSTHALPGGPSPRSVDLVDGRVAIGSPTVLTVLDAQDGEVLDQLSAPGTSFYGNTVVAADGSTWTGLEDATGPGYAKVDLDDGGVLTVARTGASYYLAAGDAGLWGVAAGEAVAELDPASGAVLRTVALPFRPFGLAVTDGALWAQSARGGQLARVDAVTGEVADGPTLRGSGPLASDGDDLWVVEPETATVVRIDGDSAEVLDRVALPGTQPERETRPTWSVAVADGRVHVASRTGSTRLLTSIDATDGTVVDVVELGEGPPVLVAADEDAVWFAGGAAQASRVDR